MSEKKNFIKMISDEFKDFVQFIEKTTGNPTSEPLKLFYLIRSLGWNIPSSTDLSNCSLGILKTGIEIVQTLSQEEIDFIKLVELIQKFISSVGDLIDDFDLDLETELMEEFVEKFPRQFLDFILASYIEQKNEKLFFFLMLLGIIEENYYDENLPTRLSYISKEIHWERLQLLFSTPQDIPERVYGWGTTEFNHSKLLGIIYNLLLSFNIPAVYDLLGGDMIDKLGITENSLIVPILEIGEIEIGIEIYPLNPTSDGENDGGLAFAPYVSGSEDLQFTINEFVRLIIETNIILDKTIGCEFRPQTKPKFFALEDDSEIEGSLKFTLSFCPTDNLVGNKTLIIGNPQGNRFEIGNFDLLFGIDVYKDQDPEIYGEVQFNNGKIVINIGEGDGFIQKILPLVNIESNFDLTFGYSTLRGVYFRGSATLEIIIPIHKQLGPINLNSIYISISTPDSGVIPIILAVSFSAKLGPVSATVKNIGLLANLSFPEEGGNLGPVNLDLGFKWPLGVGLSIDTSGLTGGGFLEFDPDNGRYVGILQLSFSEIGLVAITLITTKMPDGSKGFSMLSMINVTFDPAISLPYNFKLHGVGGLLGIQRTMKIDVIRDGLKSGILDSVMFPEGDIIQRASQIISDLRSIFPPTEGRYVIGLMAKLSWSELIFGDLGLFIEVPMPIKIAILGQIYTYLPSEEDPIVEIHLDILGELKLEQKKLYSIASIYNSRILKFNLSGDGYIGVSWGDKPYFVLSLGGFHPKDKSIPSDVPALRRLKLSIGKGNNPRLSLETYFAITSATLGFGAKLELYAKAGKFSIEGYLGFDTLFIFSPFSFEVELGGGVAVKAGGKTLLSISLDMSLDGPTPWHAKGKAKFKILFFEIKVGFNVKWGKKEKATLPSVDPWPDLEEVLKHKKSWGGALPEGGQMPVLIRLNENTGTEIVVFPTGFLEIRQSILPLGIKITKYKNTKPAGGISQFDIKCISIIQSNDEESSIILDTDPTLDYFARPQYQEMSDSEKLSSPAYEKLESGKRCQAREISVDIKCEYELVYETEVIDENKCARILDPSPCKWIMSKYLMKGGIAALAPIFNSGSAKYRVPIIMPKGELVEEAYAIVNTNDMALVGSVEIPNNGNSTYVQTLQSMEEYLVNHPEKVGEIQIVPQSEVNIVNG